MNAPFLFAATSWIDAGDTWALWALILAGVALSIYLEQNYRWAARLSGPVLALVIAMLLSNLKIGGLRIMPNASPVYDVVGNYLVPVAVSLLLLRANLFKIARTTGTMFFAFHLAVVGTLLGAGLAGFLFRDRIADLPEVTGIMTASYIGGGVNFFAMKQVYNVSENLTNPLLVADNFIMAGMFMVMLLIPERKFFRRWFPHPHSQDVDLADSHRIAAEHWEPKPIGLLDIARGLAVAVAIAAVASQCADFFRPTPAPAAVTSAADDLVESTRGAVESSAAAINKDATFNVLMTQITTSLVGSVFVWITVLSVIAATVLHRSFERINGTQEIGGYLLYIYLFVIGLPADLLEVVRNVPLLFLFCLVIAVTNLFVTLVAGKLFRLNLEELLICVNASLGGAPTAAAMAIGKGWPRLVLPGILVGLYGYVIGTALGIAITETLRVLR